MEKARLIPRFFYRDLRIYKKSHTFAINLQMKFFMEGTNFNFRDTDELVQRIQEKLARSGKKYYSEFYVGITNDANRRLFEEHKVSKEKGWWIYATTSSEEEARKVERYFLDLGMRGGTGGGRPDSNIVYCYAVTPFTAEGNE